MEVKFSIHAALATAGICLATTAYGADLGARSYSKALPIDPPYSWTGFYVGVNAGSGWGKTSTDEFCLDCNVPGHIFPLGNHTYSGFIGGGQIGYNYQFGNFAAGIEGDFDGTNIRGSLEGLQNEYVNATRYNWIASVRGRAGFTLDRIFVYATAGVAFGNIEHSSLDFGSGAPAASSTKTGSVVGGGLEYALDNHWSVKGEYLAYDFGNNRLQTNFVPALPIYFQYTDRLQCARAGVNYRF